MTIANRLVVAIVMGLFVSGIASAEEVQKLKIGSAVEGFTLLDAAKKEATSLGDLAAKDKKAVAVLFIATQCPVSNAYNERMEVLHQAYAKKGIQFVGINSNKQEPIPEIVEHAKTNKITFPVLKDVDNKIADYFHASVTPEVYLLEVKRDGGAPQYLLRYHGWLDDSQNLAKITSKDFAAALDAFLGGKPIPKTETKAFGCTIKRVKKEAPSATP